MAKRKKKQSNIIPFEKEKEQLLSMMQNQLGQQDFKNKDEAQAFLNQFTGNMMSESLADFNQDTPSDYDMAMDLVERAEGSSTLQSRRKLTKEAIALCPHCFDAYRVLALSYSQAAKGIELFEKGIVIGREHFADQIADSPMIEGKTWLWGDVEARPFLRMMHDYAFFLEEHSKFAEAQKVYSQMLELNATDNQGVREHYLYLLVLTNQKNETKKLLAKYRDDSLLSMQVGAVTFTFLEELDSLAEEDIGKIDESLEKVAKNQFFKLMPKTKKAVIELLKRNPFLQPCFVKFEHVLNLPEPSYVSYKGVDEAIAAAQLYSALWKELILPIYAIAWAPCNLPKKLDDNNQRWFSMLMKP